MSAETIHRSEPIPGTVTLCDRRPLADPDHATVCWPVGTEWVSAEPRPATVEEVAEFARVALREIKREIQTTISMDAATTKDPTTGQVKNAHKS